MSVDLNDPEIARVRNEVLDPASPTTWFLCQYSPSATSPALSVVASGPDPIIPQWTAQLEELRTKGDEVAFGYGDFKGKGCVIHYLTDKMGGVKRARAVVHSRAFASLFSDYSALITIADPSQLSQELINEKLGLNYSVHQNQHAQPVRTSPTTEERTPSTPQTAKRENGTLPPTPPAQPRHAPPQLFNPAHFPSSSQTTSSPLGTSPSFPQDGEHTHAQQRSRHVSESGSGSEPQPERQRKVSLTQRLGKAFGNPAMQGRTSDPPGPPSPSSPASSSKFKTSISKAFRRTSADQPPSGGRSDSPDAPPVPPKDEPSPKATRRPSDTPSLGQYRTPSGGMGYSPAAVSSPRSDSLPQHTGFPQTNGSPSGSLTPSNAATQNHSTAVDTRLSPSPSAQRVFTEARIKSISQEEEIQNRFRRDLHLEDTGTSSAPVVNLNDDDQEEDLRLPYDVSDDHLSEKSPVDDTTKPVSNVEATPAPLQLGPPISTSNIARSEPDAVDDRPQQDTGDQPTTNGDHGREDASEHGIQSTGSAAAPAGRAEESLEDRGSSHEQEAAAAAAEAARAKEAEEAGQGEGEERMRCEEEAARKIQEAEDAERLRLEEIEAERIRVQAEESARREEEARRVREAEELRVREEEEARRKAEEEEELRIALEEKRRIEEVRAKEEAERQRQEEERRVQAEKEAAERVRKESIKQSLLDGKSGGGVMLRGYVTVQTTKSLIWRRRYFHLLSGEMRLFKSEGDEKPIQSIHLGPNAKIEHTYEESQVQGSWKIISDGQDGREEFFVFADSPEEKETILEGLQMAIS